MNNPLHCHPLSTFLEAIQEGSPGKLEASLAQSVTLTVRSFRQGVMVKATQISERETVLSIFHEKLIELKDYDLRVAEGTASRAALEWGLKKAGTAKRPHNYTLLVEFDESAITRLVLSHDT